MSADPDDAERPAVPGLRVGRLLGRGGSSAVWLVTDDEGRRLALKVLAPVPAGAAEGRGAERAVVPGRRGRRAATGAAPSPASGAGSNGAAAPSPSSGVGSGVGMSVLVRELRFLQRFTHDHLVRVHGVVETDQGPGLLMDLAPGGSLLALVTSRGPLPIPEVVTALVPVAQALGYLHGAGALHGDVTPGNILFTAEGKPLLGDVGAGRLLGAGRDGVAGTPGFLDPLHDGSFDAGADVFALAAVAWFALTGRIPGPAEQRPPLALIVPEVPLELMQLIEDALSSDRDRRPTADHFARGLLAGSAPAPVDLVPAVHASVLPELLTRRADPPPGDPPSRWRRPGGIRPSAGGGGPGAVRAERLPGGSSREARLRGPRSPGGSVPAARPRGGRRRGRGQAPASRRAGPVSRQRGRSGSRERRTRGVLALLAGVAAVVLLVAGMALTLDVVRSTEPAAGRAPDAAPDAVRGAAPGAVPGGAPANPGPDPAAPGPSDRSEAGGGKERPGADPARDGTGTGSPDTDRAARPGDPAVALHGLADARARAFAEADPDLLTMVDVAGSPAMAADREAVGALAGTGRALRDLSIDIRDPAALTDAELADLPALASLPAVTDPPRSTEVSVVRATAALSSYTETASAPALQGSGPSPLMAADRQELIFILWRSADGWRIHSVVAPPA